MAANPSAFLWYELLTEDPDAAAAFHGAVMGWTVRDSGQAGMDYRLWLNGETPVGGLMALPEGAKAAGMQAGWLGYLHVEDVDASLSRIEAAGGAVRMPPRDVPGVGRMAMIADPQGAPIYVMAPAGEGPSASFQQGTVGHGGWNELRTSDPDAAFAFYGDEFGWQKGDAIEMGPLGIYQLFGAGAQAMGGMMKLAEETPPHWLYYFNVDAIEPARERIEAAGGEVMRGPHQVPGGSWIVQGRDPQGAVFALVAPKRE